MKKNKITNTFCFYVSKNESGKSNFIHQYFCDNKRKNNLFALVDRL